MTKEQIDFLKSLDPLEVHGTIQSVLMGDNLTKVPFEQVARFLLTQLVREKDFLIAQNTKLSTTGSI